MLVGATRLCASAYALRILGSTWILMVDTRLCAWMALRSRASTGLTSLDIRYELALLASALPRTRFGS